jgi:hypothetical protein
VERLRPALPERFASAHGAAEAPGAVEAVPPAVAALAQEPARQALELL